VLPLYSITLSANSVNHNLDYSKISAANQSTPKEPLTTNAVDEAFPPIFSDSYVQKMKDSTRVKPSSPFAYSLTNRESFPDIDRNLPIEPQQQPKELLNLEVREPPVFDNRGAATRYAAQEIFHNSPLIGLSLQKSYGNSDDSVNSSSSTKKPYGASIGTHGVGAEFKGNYTLLPHVRVEGTVTTEKDIQLMVPLTEFHIPGLPKNAKTTGGIMYDIKNRNQPELNGKPSISFFSRF